jgi:twitching motility two-component system response regulator PilG
VGRFLQARLTTTSLRCGAALDSMVQRWDIASTWRALLAPYAKPAGERLMEDKESSGNLAGLKVMVIDDSKTIRRTAETLLKKEGCSVVTATDGFEALSKIADHQPQIIFVDIMMPRLDGYQTCALIKNNQVFRGTPVIMLSSKDGLFDKAKGRIVGSEEYLTKPFTREELLGAIRRHVDRS